MDETKPFSGPYSRHKLCVFKSENFRSLKSSSCENFLWEQSALTAILWCSDGLYLNLLWDTYICQELFLLFFLFKKFHFLFSFSTAPRGSVLGIIVILIPILGVKKLRLKEVRAHLADRCQVGLRIIDF